MKVVILAGGLGTRLSEETDIKPKPMVEIGEYPIIWHIMKIYSHYGFNDFVIALGYKGYVIKEYFANYFLHKSDVEIDIHNNTINYLNSANELKLSLELIDRAPNLPAGCTAVTVASLLFFLWNFRRLFIFTSDSPSPYVNMKVSFPRYFLTLLILPPVIVFRPVSTSVIFQGSVAELR